MAKQETVSTDTLADLTGAIKALADQGRRKQVPVHQYTPQTPWNPSGTKRRVKLKHPAVFQNGARLNPMMLSDEEIELLNRLRPGVYNRKKWRVVKRRNKSIDIQYPNKSIEQRLDLQTEAPSLTAMLQKILLEAEEQDRRRKAGEIVDDDDE